MYFYSLKSCGSNNNILPLKQIKELSKKVESILINSKSVAEKYQEKYIVLNDTEQIIYISNLDNLIDYSSILSSLYLAIGKIVKVPNDFYLVTSELHVRWPNCEPIPSHQDNFYHCFSTPSSFKVLVPLTKLDSSSGHLNYADIGHDSKVLKHVASSVPAFSSYIPQDTLNQEKLRWVSYPVSPGDISWHSINSIHYANTNLNTKPSYFFVFRFDHIDSIVNKKMQNEYESVYNKHKILLRNKL